MAMKCYWDRNEKEIDVERYSRSMKYKRLVDKRRLLSKKADPPLVLFDSAPENIKGVLGDKEIMKNIFNRLPTHKKKEIAPMCKLWAKWFLADTPTPGARWLYDRIIYRVERQGRIYFYRDNMEVYSYCGCYELRTIEEMNAWHHTHFPDKYAPDGTLVGPSRLKNKIQNISSDDESTEVIEISSDIDEIDPLLACDEVMSELSDELSWCPSSDASDDNPAPTGGN